MSKSTHSSWQAVLQKIIQIPGERQRLISALAINQLTLDRWLKNLTQPNRTNLSALVHNVPPEFHDELLDALRADNLEFDNHVVDTEEGHISADFYIEVLDLRAGIMEGKRNREIIDAVLNQALVQLDPLRQGMAITIAQCMPPRSDGIIHSLRERSGRGTPPWPSDLESLSIFLGMESLAGVVVQNQHSTSIDDLSKQDLLPAIQDEYEVSAAAVPLLYEGNIAGCLLASSTVAEHFTRQCMELMEEFANLLTVGMEPATFYPQSQVHLGTVLYESADKQREVIHTFRDRLQQLIRSTQSRAPIKYAEAEERVWAELEEEIIAG
jgi:hypothetical protein